MALIDIILRVLSSLATANIAPPPASDLSTAFAVSLVIGGRHESRVIDKEGHELSTSQIYVAK